jgi:DNA (cytosine-5)-methyltransferase 1
MYTVLDLFCGAGGFSCGLEQCGFKILAGIDNDELALKTFAENHSEAKVINHDLSTIDDTLFKKLSKNVNEKVDIIVGGPPCQGFSVAGKRLEDDPRNTLWKAYIDIVKYYSPQILVLENVPAIKSLYNGEVARKIIQSFDSLGYSTDFKILLASDFGVPQNRKRAFFIAVKSKNASFEYPEARNLKVTCEDALSDLPLLENCLGEDDVNYSLEPITAYQKEMRKGSRVLKNHTAVNHTKKTKATIALVPDGGNYKNLPDELKDTRKVNIAWTRMNSKKPCFTIDAGHNHHFHYQANRVPTVRECARIQSFPDTFEFFGNRTSQYRQVGNAVPPLLGHALGIQIKKVLDSV